MQKKLIALAVASLASGAAFAQTNVTIYGIADAGYVYSSGDPGKLAGVNIPGTNTFSGIVSGILSGSRLGFRGEEALGNGLKAIFTLEYALNIDDNSGLGAVPAGTPTGLQSRQQFVGLSSATLGTVALGRQYSPGYQATANNDPMGGALVESQSFLSNNAGYTITPNSPARWDNALTYTSPNWSGFSAKAIYSFGETKDAAGTYNDKNVSITDNSKWALGANYANGPLNIDVVYQARDNIRPSGTPAINSFDTQEWYVGGSYDLKMVKLMGSWQGMNVSNSTRLVNNSQVDSQLWQIGAVIPVLSASNIHLGYAQLMMDGNNKAVIPLTGDSQSATLAWTTALSKRTTFYAGYVWAQNDKKSIAAAPVGGGILTSAIGARGEDSNTLTAGLRHSF
jgi:predicted porin